MSFLNRALTAYRKRYIDTGSAEPLVQVISIIGTFAFLAECRHHHSIVQAAERERDERLHQAEAHYQAAEAAVVDNQTKLGQYADTIKEHQTKIQALQDQQGSLTKAVQEAKDALDKLKAELPAHH